MAAKCIFPFFDFRGLQVASPDWHCGAKWCNAGPLGFSGTNYNDDGGSGNGDKKARERVTIAQRGPQEWNFR